jgi:Na+-transporting methylmalonyl-CoA/oxaloacetate decarboxylase gamma subunit
VSIEWFRDLAIIIMGLGITIVAIFIGVLAWLLYRKVKPILKSVKATTKTVEKFSVTVEEEVYRPLAQVAAFIQGIRQAVNLAGRFTKAKRGGRDD